MAIALAGTRSAAALQARTSDGVIDSSKHAVNCINGDMTTGVGAANGAAAGAVVLNPSPSSPVGFGASGSSFFLHSWLLKKKQPYDRPEEVMVLAPNTQRYEFTHVFSSSMSEQSFKFPSLSSSILAVFGFLNTILPVLPFGCCGALGSPGTAATSSGASPGQVHISTGQSGGVFPQLMRHQASDDDKLMAELGLVGRPAFEPYLAGGKSSDGSEFPSVAPSIREGAARARAETEAKKNAKKATA